MQHRWRSKGNPAEAGHHWGKIPAAVKGCSNSAGQRACFLLPDRNVAPMALWMFAEHCIDGLEMSGDEPAFRPQRMTIASYTQPASRRHSVMTRAPRFTIRPVIF